VTLKDVKFLHTFENTEESTSSLAFTTEGSVISAGKGQILQEA